METKIPEIPSEYIEPYLKQFLKQRIESVAYGFETPEEARQLLKGVEYFVSSFCAIHSRYATSNEYSRFTRLSNEDMLSICKKVFDLTPSTKGH